MRINGTSYRSEIKLSDAKVPQEVQILRTGKFNHPTYGEFEITSQILAEMKANFESKIRGVDVAFDYFHESDKEASAWVTGLELREGDQELWATVDWTPKAQQKLADRELRYFSPDFSFQWTDPEKGVTFNNVLFGGALTNRPFVKEMKAIVATENQGDNMTELEKAKKEIDELKAKNVKLSEDNAAAEAKLAAVPPAAPADKVKELEAKIAALQAELAKAKGEGEAAMAEKKKLEEAAQLAEKTTAFNVLMTEGKACAAQKDAFLKGDMTEFIKLAQPLNNKGAGSSTSTGDKTVDEKNASIIKLADEKQKANPKLDRGSAVSEAKKEIESKK